MDQRRAVEVMAEIVEVEFGASTDVGLVRDLNEDAVLAISPVFAVADGMGGHAAGEIASALALVELQSLGGRLELHQADVTSAVRRANESILQHEEAEASTLGMGTTLTGVCLGSLAGTPHWFVFNVGDSRVYHYSEGELRQVTTDHSEVAELVAAGTITSEQALVHPMRNVVTRSLGTRPGPEADIWVRPVVAGERFLICSDGLSLEISDEEIAQLLAVRDSAQVTADALVLAARNAGGRDNISVVIVDVPTAGAAEPVDESTTPRETAGAAR